MTPTNGVTSSFKKREPSPCPYCDKSFNSAQGLNLHWDKDTKCRAVRITARKRKYRYAKKPPRLGPR